MGVWKQISVHVDWMWKWYNGGDRLVAIWLWDSQKLIEYLKEKGKQLALEYPNAEVRSFFADSDAIWWLKEVWEEDMRKLDSFSKTEQQQYFFTRQARYQHQKRESQAKRRANRWQKTLLEKGMIPKCLIEYHFPSPSFSAATPSSSATTGSSSTAGTWSTGSSPTQSYVLSPIHGPVAVHPQGPHPAPVTLPPMEQPLLPPAINLNPEQIQNQIKNLRESLISEEVKNRMELWSSRHNSVGASGQLSGYETPPIEDQVQLQEDCHAILQVRINGLRRLAQRHAAIAGNCISQLSVVLSTSHEARAQEMLQLYNAYSTGGGGGMSVPSGCHK